MLTADPAPLPQEHVPVFLVRMFREIMADHEAQEARNDEMLRNELRGEMCAISGRLDRLIEQVERVANKQDMIDQAFLQTHRQTPDYDGHRNDHEHRMQAARRAREFRDRLGFEVVKFGALGLFGWALVELWQSFLRGPK